MAKIYISSTSSDLEDHRKRAYAQMRKHGHDVLTMEDYNPGTRRPIHKCREDVRDTDIYVVLIGWQYGSVPTDDNRKGYSYTENEYDEALKHEKEIIALLVDEKQPWPPAYMDSHTGHHEAGAKVKAFRARVSANHLRGKFTTPDQLAAALSPAVQEACANLTPIDRLDDVADLSREDLQNLAARFGIENCFDLPDETLRRQLSQKADDYRRILREVDNLKGHSSRIDNSHATAMGALRSGKFEDARIRIEEAKEIQNTSVLLPSLEANEKLTLTQVDLELLEGDLESAFALLSKTAESFVVIDQVEKVTRIIKYCDVLRDYARRYGGRAHRKQLELLDKADISVSRDDHPETWATLQTQRALALQGVGEQLSGAEGLNSLRQSEDYFRAALEVYDRKKNPTKWANTNINLGITLELLSRIGKRNRLNLLAGAIVAYEKALLVHTKTNHPWEWAAANVNKGIALYSRFHNYWFWQAKKKIDTLSDAEEAITSALEVFTFDQYPIDWGVAKINLAIIKGSQANFASGSRKQQLLNDSILYMHQASKVFSKTEHPVNWASIHLNVAIMSFSRARSQRASDPKTHLSTALSAIDQALEFYDPKDSPRQNAIATRLKRKVLRAKDRA